MGQGKQGILLKARRLVLVGLVLSVLGNRLLDGAVDGLVATGLLPVAWIVWGTAIGKIIEFFMPIYARILQRYSPDLALMVEDSLEVSAALGTLLLIQAFPHLQETILILYLLFLLFVYPISDIADEFYGAKIAEIDAEQALRFNSSIYIWTGGLGFILASPLGAIVSFISVQLIIFINIILTLFALAYRWWARKIFPLPAGVDSDIDDFSLLGNRVDYKEFARDIFASGFSSPLMNFIFQVIGSLTGHLLLLWAASRSSLRADEAMGLVLLIFGCASVLGPILANFAGKKLKSSSPLVWSISFSCLNILFLVFSIFYLEDLLFVVVLVFIFVNVTLNRLRVVFVETYRQVNFRGKQYSRIMSWSFTFGALGTLLGMQIAYFLGLHLNPLPALCLALLLWGLVLAILLKEKIPSSSATLV